MLKIRTYITFCAMLLVSIFIAGIAIAGPRLTKTQENCLHAWDGAVENLKADKWGMLSVDEVKSMIDAGVPFTLLA
jgi:ATP:corrinoid adenosyltransferase